MLDLRPHTQGTLLPVKASAGARRNAVTGQHAGALRVSVTAAPEKGRANAAILKLLAKELGMRPAEVKLVAGAANPRKQFLVVGVSPDELRQKVAALL